MGCRLLFYRYETLKSIDANDIDTDINMAYDDEDINKRQRKAKVEEHKEEAIKAQAPGPKTAEAFRHEASDKKTEDVDE
jgi:hypothetical protein